MRNAYSVCVRITTILAILLAVSAFAAQSQPAQRGCCTVESALAAGVATVQNPKSVSESFSAGLAWNLVGRLYPYQGLYVRGGIEWSSFSPANANVSGGELTDVYVNIGPGILLSPPTWPVDLSLFGGMGYSRHTRAAYTTSGGTNQSEASEADIAAHLGATALYNLTDRFQLTMEPTYVVILEDGENIHYSPIRAGVAYTLLQ